jgi:N-acetylglucosamine-6-phosphate deacetylase
MRLLIHHADLILPDARLADGVLYVENDRIVYAGHQEGLSRPWPTADAVIDASGLLVAPSLVELHIHGCFGHSFHDPGAATLEEMLAALAARGVGMVLPTVTAEPEYLTALDRQISARPPDGRIPGIYVEGPFVAPGKRGGIASELIHSYTRERLDECLGWAGNRVRMMAFAPELPEARELAAELDRRGIVAAFGHTQASFQDAQALGEIAPLNVTHLWNAMSGVSHKEPGLAQWALTDPDCYVELNGDGTHVHDSALKLTLAAKPWERIVLISDAVPAAGLSEGQEATYGGKRLVPRNAGAYDADSGVLMGSRLIVPEVVARVHRVLGVPLSAAVAMASANPLRLLGYRNKGSLVPGAEADIAVFEPDLSACRLTISGGRVLHAAGPFAGLA